MEVNVSCVLSTGQGSIKFTSRWPQESHSPIVVKIEWVTVSEPSYHVGYHVGITNPIDSVPRINAEQSSDVQTYENLEFHT